MENSKSGNIPMQEKPNLSKSQGGYTPEEVKRMQRVPYGSAIGSIIFGTDKEERKSQSRYVFVLNGGAIDYKSAKRTTIMMSSTETEYIATSKAAMEAVWMRKLIDGLGIVLTNKEPMEILCNNTCAISIANEPNITKDTIDPFTKPMSLTKHTEHVRNIWLRLASSLM
ncbi:hypothetical protein Tco_1387537 [Tanacetum coccineum]